MNRLSAFPTVATPGFAWFAWKYSSRGAHTLFLWLKKSIPPAATIFRLVLALAIAWYVAVSPPVNRIALSSFSARATVCNGFEPLYVTPGFGNTPFTGVIGT